MSEHTPGPWHARIDGVNRLQSMLEDLYHRKTIMQRDDDAQFSRANALVQMTTEYLGRILMGEVMTIALPSTVALGMIIDGGLPSSADAFYEHVMLKPHRIFTRLYDCVADGEGRFIYWPWTRRPPGDINPLVAHWLWCHHRESIAQVQGIDERIAELETTIREAKAGDS